MSGRHPSLNLRDGTFHSAGFKTIHIHIHVSMGSGHSAVSGILYASVDWFACAITELCRLEVTVRVANNQVS
jgi:hypothetical protein